MGIWSQSVLYRTLCGVADSTTTDSQLINKEGMNQLEEFLREPEGT
jgi:hypothetical protein